MTLAIVKGAYFTATGLYMLAVVEVTEVSVSAWTPDKVTALITAVFAGLAVLITALGGLIVLMIQLKTKTEAVHVATVEAAKIGQGVHEAVNGANSALLARIDRLTTKIAVLTGEKDDIIESAAAHQEVINKAELPIQKGTEKID